MKTKLANIVRGKEGKKERTDMQSEIEINKDLDPLKTNFKGKRTAGIANKVINVEERMTCLKN